MEGEARDNVNARYLTLAIAVGAAAGTLTRPETTSAQSVCPTVRATCSGTMGHALYEQQTTLQETLLETRQRYAAWLATQPAARKAVTLGDWLVTPILPAAEGERLVRPTQGVDLSGKRANGQPLWSQQKGLADGKAVRFLGGSGTSVVYLTRTLQARKPVTLTVGIGGGDHLDVWLNKRQLKSVRTCLTSGRYGCSRRVNGTRIDQVLLDLDLQAGENTLVLRLTLGEEPSFYFSMSPNPVPRLWEQVGRDFPAIENPLLELVTADWFKNTGWLVARDSALEEQLIDRLATDCAPSDPSIRTELDCLKRERVGRQGRRWLDLCIKASVLATLRGRLDRLHAAVSELSRAYPEEYPAVTAQDRLKSYEQQLTAQAEKVLDPHQEKTRRLMQEMQQMQRQLLVDANPLLRGAQILFVKRYTYDSKHYYDDFQHVSRWGGSLCVLSLADGRVRELVPQLSEGVFDRYDLSFDARRIVFGYRRPQREGYRLYEIGVDGSGLRPVTVPPENEEQRIAKYGKTSTGDGFYGLLGYRFWTDDVHPCYLPDGGFCFASTRCEHGVLCTPAHYLACTNLFRMNAQGKDLRPLSYGALSEFTPTMMADGRILYNRWEYVYKGIGTVQSLWVTRPDGSGGEEMYGDNVTNPGVLWQARQIPGHSRQVVCIGCGHEPLGVGQVLLLDLDRGDKRTTEPMVSLTPNVRTQGLRGLYQLRNGVWREDIYGPFYADPYPLSDAFFLVSCNPDQRYNDQSAYGIYLLDKFGNRVPIYQDDEISCWQPMPLRPRQTPPVLPAMPPSSEEHDKMATVFLSDVYRGLPGVKPGTVKYLRVMEQIPKPWAAEVDTLRGEDRSADGFGGHIAISHNAHIWVAVLLGIVPVGQDGTACFEVPAHRNVFFQALDEDFMEIQRMRTFVNFLPGEQRSCIGCHEHRTQAPVARFASALEQAPLQLSAQPGEVAPRPLDYARDVQPTFDRHCVSCHNGKDPKATPDLRGELTTMFNRSYENILTGALVNTIREWAGAAYSMQHAPAVPPYTYGSHQSKLVEVLRSGHYDVELSQPEWIKLVTWIDCGAPYYGSYYGRRHLNYRGQPDFRPVPTVSSARGIAPAFPEPVRPEPLPSRLLAQWSLGQDMSEVATDASGQGHTARVSGLVRSDGRNGHGAGRFDGKAYLEAGGLGAHEALSIAMWVKPDSLGNRWNPLLFCNDGQPGAVHFSLLPDGTPNVAINTGKWNWTHRTARASVADGNWHHVVLVCDARIGGRVRFYVDGKLANEEHLSLGQPLDLYGFRIGAYNRWEKSAASNFHGEIDDARIYAGMLTDQEVAQLSRN